MVTPGPTARLESVTAPVIVANVVCAGSGVGRNRVRAAMLDKNKVTDRMCHLQGSGREGSGSIAVVGYLLNRRRTAVQTSRRMARQRPSKVTTTRGSGPSWPRPRQERSLEMARSGGHERELRRDDAAVELVQQDFIGHSILGCKSKGDARRPAGRSATPKAAISLFSTRSGIGHLDERDGLPCAGSPGLLRYMLRSMRTGPQSMSRCTRSESAGNVQKFR